MTKENDRVPEEARPPASGLPVPSPARSANAIEARGLPPSAPGADDDVEEPRRRPVGGISLYLHSFRRRWPLAITLGLICAASAAVPAWLLIRDRYTSVALLHISSVEQQLVFADPQSSNTFEIYKNTQQQKLTSERVLIPALRQPEIAKLTIAQSQDDPVRWLAGKLRVDFPGNAEIMRISLTDTQTDEVGVLVGAVVEAYMTEVVKSDQALKKNRLKELEKLCDEKEEELRNKRTKLKQLAEQLGTGDSTLLLVKQQILLQEYAEARSEVSRLRSELQRAKDDLQFKKAWLKAMLSGIKDTPVPTVSAQDLEIAIAADRKMSLYSTQVEEIDDLLEAIRKRAKETLLTQLTKEYREKKKETLAKMAKRRKELQENLQKEFKEQRERFLKSPKNGQESVDAQIAELEVHVRALESELIEAREKLKNQSENVNKIRDSSIDVVIAQSELQQLERIIVPIADEREKLKIELRATPRITKFQDATKPTMPDGKARLQGAAIGGLLGFFGVIFLILWWDCRKQRINSAADLSHGLGLTVVGTVPRLPQRFAHAARPEDDRSRLRDSLNQSVDSIAARLFLRKNADGGRVVMISSAIQGEGKTTLAVQLATRLARTGERTLLVDYDMRRPSIHRLFGMPLGPGVTDCLLDELDVNQVVHPTDAENLSVVTAGNTLFDSLGPLANGVTTAFFEKARAAFAFVVVDACPILPVIDALLVSQHADTVILSVRRDRSEAPLVLRACEKLSAFGSRQYVVVLNGSQEGTSNYYYDRIISARVEAADPAKPAKDS